MGVANSRVALQAGTVFGVAVVGVFMARKKSMFSRILYPITAGAGVWTVFYLASEPNRQLLKKRAITLWFKFQKPKQ